MSQGRIRIGIRGRAKYGPKLSSGHLCAVRNPISNIHHESLTADPSRQWRSELARGIGTVRQVRLKGCRALPAHAQRRASPATPSD